MEGLPKIGVQSYLEKIKPTLLEKINTENKVGLKITIVLHVLMQRKKEIQEFQLRSIHIIGKGEELDYDAMIETMLLEIKNLIHVGSGWKFLEITKIDLHTIEYHPFSGSSYFPLPKEIQLKKAVINVKNTDQKCFRYSIESALLNLDKNKERQSNYNKPEFDYMFKDLEFPVKIPDIKIFEKNNPDLAINVYTFVKNQFEKLEISPVRISEKNLPEEKYINLLHFKDATEENIENENLEEIHDNANYHYAWIKNFSRLVSKEAAKRNGQVKICFRCMKVFSASTSELREKKIF